MSLQKLFGIKMKRILFVTIAYRVGERIYPTIPKLASDYIIDILCVYQMHPDFKWPGTYDMRKYFINYYGEYFNEIFYKKEDINYSNYDLIIYDDCRVNNGGGWIYEHTKCPVISCSHGNGDNMYLDNIGKVFDKLFLFGKQEVTKSYIIAAGIPSNDKLINYINTQKEHILVIINFLGNHNAPFLKSDKKYFEAINLLELQQLYNKPVVIKLKSRHNNGSVNDDQNYINSILPKNLNYKIMTDVIDDNLLIAQSEIVVGAPSTLMTKPIQLKIPTVMFHGYGQVGIFKNYPGLIELGEKNIQSALQYKITNDYIDNLIEGGSTFTSTDVFIKNIKQVI